MCLCVSKRGPVFFFGLLQQHDSNWNLEPSRAPSSSSSRVSNQRGSSPRNGPTESLTAAMRCQARQQTICEMKFQGNPSFAQLADRRPAALSSPVSPVCLVGSCRVVINRRVRTLPKSAPFMGPSSLVDTSHSGMQSADGLKIFQVSQNQKKYSCYESNPSVRGSAQ